jgi:hypothetical protein
VPARKHEAIAVRPFRIPGIVAKKAVPEDVRGRRQRHGSARVTGLRLFDRVHREDTYGVDAPPFQLWPDLAG